MKGYYEISDASNVRREHVYDDVRHPGPPSGSGGAKPRLFKNGTSDKIGGPRTSGGIDMEVLCYPVDADGNHSSDTADRKTVNFGSLHALCFPATDPTTHTSIEPAYCVWAVPWVDGKYKAISGGINYFEGEYQGGNAVTPGLGGTSVPDVTTTTFCGTVADGENVGVQLYNTVCRIVAECCAT